MLIYLIYNFLGVVFIYGILFLREILFWVVNKLVEVIMKSKLYVVGYVLIVFFIVFLILIGGSNFLGI